MDRVPLRFADTASKEFAFLGDFGFLASEALPTLVQFRKADLQVHVYHGRQSFEIGFEIGFQEDRYSMFEIIQVTDPDAALRYRDFATRDQNGVQRGLSQLALLVKRYAEPALRSDPRFFLVLEEQRNAGRNAFALDVRAEQLRPMADAAFRLGNYKEAANLYESIKPRLTPTELKKLELSRKRGAT